MKLIDEGLVGAVSEFRQEGRKADFRCALHKGPVYLLSVNSLRAIQCRLLAKALNRNAKEPLHKGVRT